MILYRILTYILYPFIYLYLIYRKFIGKENNISIKEKLGYSTIIRPEGYLIWIHAASVGEYISIKSLIDRLIIRYQTNILLTTGTLSSAKLAKDNSKIIHQYLPIDNLVAVRRFIDRWNPNLILWVESELWYNILTEASKLSHIILINAKLSERSYKKWLYLKSALEQILNRFSLILPQSLDDYTRLKSITNNKIKHIGNIKYAESKLEIDNIKINEIRKILPARKIILIAASTHPGEELIIANAYKEIRKNFPNIFLIIVPRHPNRTNDIIRELNSFNLAIRSKGEIIDNKKDIYIIDTIGELRYFYQLSDIAFIGGSLCTVGGHNPLEAILADCAVIYGANYSGFREIVNELITFEAINIVHDGDEYIKIVTRLLNDHNLTNKMKLSAKKLLDKKSNIIDRYLDEIDQYI